MLYSQESSKPLYRTRKGVILTSLCKFHHVRLCRPETMLIPNSTNDIQFWGFIQVNLGIIAACAPSLKPLIGGMSKLSSTNVSNSRLNYGTGTSGPKQQSRTRISTRNPNQGWVRTDSDIELDDESFSSRTNITSTKNQRTEL